jgi:MFS family permease
MNLSRKQKILGLKILGLLTGIAIIYLALGPVVGFIFSWSDRLEELFNNSPFTWEITQKVLQWGWEYFVKFLQFTLPLMWLPILTYIVIGLATASRRWRLFFGLVILSFSVLITKGSINEAIANFNWSDIRGSIDDFLEIYPILIYIYLLLILIIPRVFWNYLGAVIWMIASILVTFMPDLPGNFDDLGIISAIFGLIFLYINTVAYLVQRLVEPRLVALFHRGILQVLKGQKRIEVKDVLSVKNEEFKEDS